ncbi:MAG: hemerythrin domain-containing protein [Bacteroidales bacterium]|jgi:hemerythrin-like domain-containing protein|nr:hemerythrin domain-containing protein [Bacteroidales bacterium]
MSATSNLENDHVCILKLCDVMERMAQAGNIDPVHLEKVVSLIRNFADGLHHKKEEDLLFPKMAEKGFSPVQGPVAVMLHEHEEGRNYVRGIAGNIESYKSGDKGAEETIRHNLLGYSGLLKNHIAKENNVLFRMADNVLSPDEQEILSAEFKKAEESMAPGGSASYYITQVEELAKIYGIV